MLEYEAEILLVLVKFEPYGIAEGWVPQGVAGSVFLLFGFAAFVHRWSVPFLRGMG